MPRTKSVKTRFRESQNKTANFDLYQVDDSETIVTINVFPGDTGQSAVTDVLLENKKILSGHVGSLSTFAIGTNLELQTLFLDVFTIVTDIPCSPDLTSFRFQVEGGVKPYEYFMEKTVQSQGESVVYRMTVFFTKLT